MTKFDDLQALSKAIFADNSFDHEIKGKRIKKQLSALIELEPEGMELGPYHLTDLGVIFQATTQYKGKELQFQIIITRDYPFDRPQINVVNHDKFGQCRDILDSLLGTDNLWGPSMMLYELIEKIPQLAKMLIDQQQKILWAYHSSYQYDPTLLEQNGMKLHTAQLYQWRFMIKNTKQKIVGLTEESFLIFEKIPNKSTLYLNQWHKISSVKEVKSVIANKTLQLTISIGQDGFTKKFYLGKLQHIEQILEILEPIHMAQHRVGIGAKAGSNQDREQMIKDYTKLIEYYSLADTDKTKIYIDRMKKLIQEEYSQSGL